MNASDDVRIVRYDDRYAKDFARLNYEWIERYFTVEDHDREMLDAPAEYIVDKGGEIFFALVGDEVAGTVALIESGGETFELAKMAVSPKYQGKGIGDKLIDACVTHARKAGKRSIYLLSNIKLTPAINLYRKHGFRETLNDESSRYERVNIRMELAITASDM